MAIFSVLVATLITCFLIETKDFSVVVLLTLVLCAYFPFGWLLGDRLSAAWHYRRHPEHYVESTVTLTPDSVCVSNLHSDLRLNWDRLSAIVTTPRGLLFLVPPQQALLWLPERLFEGNNHKEAILELASHHAVRIRRLA